jgi:plasmid maintenance system antidote protein VapI
MALRLLKLLSTSIEMWINLQAQYDVWLIQQHADDYKIDPLPHVA